MSASTSTSLPQVMLYLVNASDGLQIFLSYLLELYLLPSAFRPVRSGSSSTSKEQHFLVGKYVIIALLGWIIKPLLAYCTDSFPWKSNKGRSGPWDNSHRQRTRLRWIMFSSFFTCCNAFVAAWAMHYKMETIYIVFLLMMCGVGLAASTSVAEAILFEKKRYDSTSMIAMSISLAMAAKISAIATAVAFAVFLPIESLNVSFLVACIGVYCFTIAIASLFVDDMDMPAVDTGFAPAYLEDAAIEKYGTTLSKTLVTNRLTIWKKYIQANGMFPIIILLAVLFATPDLRIAAQLLNLNSVEWLLQLNALLPIILQIAKLSGVAMFQLGLYRIQYQHLASIATMICIFFKMLGMFLLLLLRSGVNVQSYLGGVDLFWIFVGDSLISGAVSEVIFLALLLILCRHFPVGYEATTISIILVTSQSGSFLTKLDSVWITSYFFNSASVHLIALQAISVLFYCSSLLLLALVTEPQIFQSSPEVFTIFSDPLEATSLLKCNSISNPKLSSGKLGSPPPPLEGQISSNSSSSRTTASTRHSKSSSRERSNHAHKRRGSDESKNSSSSDKQVKSKRMSENTISSEIAQVDWSSVML